MPRDITKRICCELRYRDVTMLLRTCKDFYNILRGDDVWKFQYSKTWWPVDAETYPQELNQQSYYSRLAEKIIHIRKILADKPFITLCMLIQENTAKKLCYYKMDLKKKINELTKQIAIIHHINRTFRVVIDLPDGRQETLLSGEVTRHSKPLYHNIGIEYAIHPYSEAGNTIPYEAFVTYFQIEQKFKNIDRRNMEETQQYEYKKFRRWKKMGCPPIEYGTF